MEHGLKGTSVEGSVGIVHVAHSYQLNPVPLQTKGFWASDRLL